MAREVVMPAMEMAQDAGMLVRWLKSDGELVRKGEPLMEVETDKTLVEIEAPESGILSNITAQPGDEVPVGHVIALLLTEEESRAKPHQPLETAGRPSDGKQGSISTGPSGEIATSESEAPQKTLQNLPLNARLTPASPKARRLATEHGILLSEIPGSGPEGAVITADVAPRLHTAVTAEQSEAAYTVVPIRGKRRTIAERLQQSYRAAPHIALTLSIDMSNARQFIARTKQTASGASVQSFKVTAVLAKAVASTLLRYPRLNAHLIGEEIHEYRRVHLGIAVALKDGLIVPGIRNADQKSLTAIQSELQELTARARSGRLRPEELKGNTFTISNLGMYGIEQFSAILNPPEVGILSVGVVKDIPVSYQGQIALRSVMQATVNVDHRAVDGAEAGSFLNALKEMLEMPYSLEA